MKTGYVSKDRDLGQIFEQRRSSDAPTISTGFSLADGRDLAEIFEPYRSGPKADPVGFLIQDGRDLSDLFAPKREHDS